MKVVEVRDSTLRLNLRTRFKVAGCMGPMLSNNRT